MKSLSVRSSSESTMMDLPKFHPHRKETCCESSLMLNVRFRRCKVLNQLLPMLALLSVFANVYLVASRKKYSTSLNNNTSYHIERFLEMPQHEEPFVVKEELLHLVKSNEEIINMEVEAKKKRRHFGPKLLIPQPPALDDNATFSACLLIKDDNAILSEWIAYHYHTVNLRHLVVAVDPSSNESPASILNRWRQNTDLKVNYWNDTDYMPQSFLESGFFPTEYMQDESDFEGLSSKAYVLTYVSILPHPCFSFSIAHLTCVAFQHPRNFKSSISSKSIFSQMFTKISKHGSNMDHAYRY